MAYRDNNIVLHYFHQEPQPELKIFAYCISPERSLYLNRFFAHWYLGDSFSSAVPFLYHHALHELIHIMYPDFSEEQVCSSLKTLFEEDYNE